METWANRFKINLKAAILCLVVSAAFWFLKAMNKRYADAIYLPINIISTPSKHIKQEWVPGKVKVNASADGWYLLSRKLGLGMEPIDIELESLTSCSRIPSDYLITLLKNQFDNLEINYLYEDSFKTGYDEIVSKKIKIKLNTKKTRAGYYIIKNKIQPNTITISGPSEILDSLPNHITIDIKELEMGVSVSKKTVLLSPFFDQKIQLSEPDVMVDVELQVVH